MPITQCIGASNCACGHPSAALAPAFVRVDRNSLPHMETHPGYALCSPTTTKLFAHSNMKGDARRETLTAEQKPCRLHHTSCKSRVEAVFLIFIRHFMCSLL